MGTSATSHTCLLQNLARSPHEAHMAGVTLPWGHTAIGLCLKSLGVQEFVALQFQSSQTRLISSPSHNCLAAQCACKCSSCRLSGASLSGSKEHSTRQVLDIAWPFFIKGNVEALHSWIFGMYKGILRGEKGVGLTT